MPIPSLFPELGDDVPPPFQLLDMAAGFLVTRATATAAGLGLADHLADGSRSVEELAEATGTHVPSLRRLLRLLAGGGIVSSDGAGRYRLTERGECLRSDHPVSMGSLFRMLDGPVAKVALEMGYTVRTGETADRAVLGAEMFEHLAKHPAEGAVFDEAMTEFRRQFTGPIMLAYDFSCISTLVDVGGGHGFFLSSVLLANPSMSGVLFDQPHVADVARTKIEEAGLSGRCRVVGGDFFESVPEGGDGYVLSWIVHDWDEERGLRLLRNCRRAIGPGGRLLLVESVVPEGDVMHFSKVLDAFLMPLGGIERTEAEYADLLARAGFRLERTVPTLSPLSVLEAAPA